MGAKSPPIIRVLVLEEDSHWREALAGMYRSVLGQRGEVIAAPDPAAAERVLAKQPVDVLSLDLSLSSDGADGGPLLCDTARLRLIELAAKRRWAAAVVLIVRADIESQSRFIACDEQMLDEATVSPDEFVRRRFGERGLVLNQPARWDMATSIARFEEVIRRRLNDLVRRGYSLRFGGTAYQQRVIIEADRQSLAAFEGADATLLQLLAIAERAGELLSDRSVLEIYRGPGSVAGADGAAVTRLAQREIDGFRRRLRGQGIDDRALIARVRKSVAGDKVLKHATGAWRLDGSVAVEGASSLNVRARGGSGFRPDAPAPAES